MKILPLTFLSCSLCFGSDTWTPQQKKLEIAYLTVLACDWRQTSDFHKTWGRPGEVLELNPILGPKPPQSDINRYFLTGAILHIGIANMLPSKWRTRFIAGTLVVQTVVVARNQFCYKVNIKF